MPVKELLTERLRLRDWRPEDAETVYAGDAGGEMTKQPDWVSP